VAYKVCNRTEKAPWCEKWYASLFRASEIKFSWKTFAIATRDVRKPADSVVTNVSQQNGSNDSSEESHKMTQAEGVKRMMQLTSDSVLVVGVLVLVALLSLMLVLSVLQRISASMR